MIDPPYSVERCKECAKACILTCPPYEPRRTRRQSVPATAKTYAGSADSCADSENALVSCIGHASCQALTGNQSTAELAYTAFDLDNRTTVFGGSDTENFGDACVSQAVSSAATAASPDQLAVLFQNAFFHSVHLDMCPFGV